MEIISMKKILSYFLALAILTTATLAFAHPYSESRRVRLRDPRVNTRVEARYDRNHDGWINRRERRRMRRAHLYRHRHYSCDYNRNGWIDTRREKRCL